MTNNPFSPSIPMLQIAWDSTSLGLLKSCPRKYQLKMIENWSVKGERLHLDFGIYYHSALEEYDKAKALGADHEEGVHAAVRKALEISKDFIGTDNPKAWESKGNVKNRFTLVRAIVWYLEHFKDDPAKTVILDNGKPAVELSFKMELPFTTPDGDQYIACGHLDRLVEFADQIFVLDRKTTGGTISSYYYNQYNPNNQISLYTLASRIVLPKAAAGVIIDACQLAVGFARFHRGMIMKSQGQLDEWLEDTGRWIKIAEQYAKNQHFPMNDTACSMYGGCEFRDVCKNDPSVRSLILNSEFEKSVWNPLVER